MQNYTTVMGVIQMREAGSSVRECRRRYGIGTSTVQLIMDRYRQSGLSFDDLIQMEPQKLLDTIYPPDSIRRKEVPLPDFQRVYDRLMEKGSKANLFYLWTEYKRDNPAGYQYSQYVEYFNRYVEEHYAAKNVSMAVERVPGEKVFIDWVGDQPELIYDPETGEVQKAHVFVTTVGVSSYIYAELFPNEKLLSFVSGTVHALEYYDAVPKYLVPDNAATAVTKHTKDELLINSTYQDLESFYGVIVLPPPPERYDKPHMKALSDGSFTTCDYVSFNRVPENYHLLYDDHYYSVFYTYYNKPVILKATMTEIRICDQNNRLICTHQRSYKKFPRYITKDEHMEPSHRFYKEVNHHDGDYYRRWASSIGKEMYMLIDTVLHAVRHEEQAYNSCNGILHMCDGISKVIANSAARKCIELNSCKYSYFKRILNDILNNGGRDSSEALPEHQNLWGKDFYK